MNYGWAILVVIAAVGALSYTGVLSYTQVVPESCTAFQGIFCEDSKVSETDIQLVLRNGLGETITINNVTATNCDGFAIGTLLDNEQKTFLVPGCNFTQDMKYAEKFYITYTGYSELPHTKSGELVTRIERTIFAQGQGGAGGMSVSYAALHDNDPGYPFRNDMTERVVAKDYPAVAYVSVKKNTRFLHVNFTQQIGNGDDISIWCYCNRVADIQIKEPWLNNTVATGTCSPKKTWVWVNVTISGASSPRSDWDFFSTDSKVYYDLINSTG